jgi:hypothetical protein
MLRGVDDVWGIAQVSPYTYDDDNGHQCKHLTLHNDNRGPVFDGMDENGSWKEHKEEWDDGDHNNEDHHGDRMMTMAKMGRGMILTTHGGPTTNDTPSAAARGGWVVLQACRRWQ